MKSSDLQLLLLDNGSIKPAATLRLRELAEALSRVISEKVEAVSLRHADRISADQLAGEPAQTLRPFLTRQLQQGRTDFLIIPLFFANSGALTRYLPQQIEQLREQFSELRVILADVLYPLPQGESRLVEILHQQLSGLEINSSEKERHIILVDHGSPEPQVTQVRQQLAKQLLPLLGQKNVLDQAVMERREGAEFDFNGALLEDLLIRKAQQGVEQITVLMQFLLPGRHAGEGGDVARICANIEQQFPRLRIQMTPLVAEHPALVEILHTRINQALHTVANLDRQVQTSALFHAKIL